MRVDVSVLAVIGHKKTGKTTVIEALTSELVSRGFRITDGKRVSKKDFSLDTKGKDTWRLTEAGANPVIVVSNKEMIIKINNGFGRLSLERILKTAEDNDADVLILEGFSSIVLKDSRIGKIVCLRSSEEYQDFKEKAQGDFLALCSLQPLKEPILNIKNDLPVIIEKAMKFIETRKKISEILGQLAGLDCGKCGKATCEDLAEAIYEGQASLSNCVPLSLKPKLKTRITVRGSEVPLQPFVSKILQRSILGMVSSLKGVKVEGDEEVRIDIGTQSKS